jgi:putative Holliday junction resolvase
MLDIEEFKKKLDKKSRLMGIDPGKKRIGIAISDENKIIATPYTTLIKNNYLKFIEELKIIIKENDIKGIIVGNPINLDGSVSQSSRSAKDLALNISKDITKNITLWDERLSSQGAFNLSSNLDINTSKKIEKLDQNSAQFILQGALDYLSR